ncbi:hypothetical protein FEM21_19180 [Flavobacterium seoulense]|uniref:Uncharacterized protein n=1 Tax=Flavobacterium seoulense TaxID=1492738 RepID=A0A066WQR5_9FLAO|nr:hypothetical protein FEM21_19180 [Flavobacterium seoulense]
MKKTMTLTLSCKIYVKVFLSLIFIQKIIRLKNLFPIFI